MPRQFTVFDVETANAQSASICSIGIAVVRDNVLVDEFYSLVNPKVQFSFGNIAIHGITPDQVEDAPTFDELWPTIRGYFDNQLVLAHFAVFDIGCLRASLNRYHIDDPQFIYSCTVVLGRKAVPESYNHRLNTLADYYGFTFQHHNAMEDARIAAMIAIKYLEAVGYDDMDDLHHHYQVKYKSFITSSPRSSKISTPIPKPIFTKTNETHLFYRKHICITGTLKEERDVVYQQLANLGVYIDEKITVMTDFLVVGKLRRESSKIKEAKRMELESQLQIIDEDLFYTMLHFHPHLSEAEVTS